MELAKFYNSLWFYYNCESQFVSQNIVQPIWDENKNSYIQKGVESCWNPLPGCGDKYPKLPYTPQGYLYSFNNWLQDWTPWINSDSTVDAKNITGSFPNLTNTDLISSTLFVSHKQFTPCIHMLKKSSLSILSFSNVIKNPANKES